MPTSALLLSLGIETLAIFAPFRLLRPLSTAHADPKSAPNAEILGDRPIALLATLLAGAIYSVSLLAAYATYLPTLLVTYFGNLKTLAPAHEPARWAAGTLPVTLALGLAAYVFVFAPAEATGRTEADAVNERFDPVAAGLSETLRWNVWGWSDQTKTAIRRTALLSLVTGINTFLQTRFAIVGVETAGALAWSSVWVFAGIATGLGLGAVGSV